MGELCQIIRHLGSGIMLTGEQFGLQTRIAAPERIILRCNRRLSWPKELVKLLEDAGHIVIPIGCTGEG